MTIFRFVLHASAIVFTFLSLSFSLFSLDEKVLKDSGNISSGGIARVSEDLRKIWPSGKCADNIIGNKSYVLLTVACKANYTSDNRKEFLDQMLGRGWKLIREDYHIDKNNANYFYKFQVDLDHNVFIKLFFKDPSIIWPLHENERPKIRILLNDVQSLQDIEFWAKIKLPLSISISMAASEREQIVESAKKLNYDIWLFLPDMMNSSPVDEPVLENQEVSSEKNPPPPELPEALSDILKKNPDQNFPYSGLSIASTNPHIKDIQILRNIFTAMKKEGLRKFAGPTTLEIQDTARILEIASVDHTFYLGLTENINETVWQDALANAKENGSSVIILDAKNIDARSFLLKMIQDTINFVDYTTMEHFEK